MIQKLQSYLEEQVDNTGLIFFRLVFGLLVIAESFGAIATGWVSRAFIQPEVIFPFIGFEWMRVLSGEWMYVHYVIMGICGIFILLGYRYRWAAVIFLLMWTASYLMQKTSYNNHYYLFILISLGMALAPASRRFSLDSSKGRISGSNTTARIFILMFIVQVVIVYVFAAWNKIYPGWLEAKPMDAWLSDTYSWPIVGDLFRKQSFHLLIAYGGIIFDGSVAFLLLYKPTRRIGVIFSFVFHLFNSIVFQIGIFPYLMLGLTALFFPGEELNRKFPWINRVENSGRSSIPSAAAYFFLLYFSIQLYLPIRHYFYEGHVLVTEEGHRMAWQMMLRRKTGATVFTIVDKATGQRESFGGKHLTRKQRGSVSTHPDMMWQYAQYLKKRYREEEGKEIEVYAKTNISLNGGPNFQLIDPEVNLAAIPWDYFKHSEWIWDND